MIISRVESRLDENKFIKFASNLYKGDEYWIRPLDKDVSNVFKPETRKYYSIEKIWSDNELKDEKISFG